MEGRGVSSGGERARRKETTRGKKSGIPRPTPDPMGEASRGGSYSHAGGISPMKGRASRVEAKMMDGIGALTKPTLP